MIADLLLSHRQWLPEPVSVSELHLHLHCNKRVQTLSLNISDKESSFPVYTCSMVSFVQLSSIPAS